MAKPTLTSGCDEVIYQINNENIFGESVVSAGLSTFPLVFIILSDLLKSTIPPYLYTFTFSIYIRT